MHVQILRFFRSRPGEVVIGIPDFVPGLSDVDDVFPEDASISIDVEAFLAAAEPDETIADLDDGAVGGLTFAMEYRDSRNAVTRRRITLNGFRPTDRGHCLMRAYCHERKAARSFRTDRIVAIIDLDGVIWEPIEYFEDLGIKLPLVSDSVAEPAVPEGSKPGERQRAVCADELCILAALSHSDDYLHDREVAQILDFAADACDRLGVSFEEVDREALNRYIRRLRPGIVAVGESLMRLKTRNDTAADKRLVRAMIAVMDADDQQSPEELAFISEVMNELGA